MYIFFKKEQVGVFQVDEVCLWNPAGDKVLIQRLFQESRLWGQGADAEPLLDTQCLRGLWVASQVAGES